MNEWALGIALAVIGAALTAATPVLVHRLRARKGALAAVPTLNIQPQAYLHPHGAPPSADDQYPPRVDGDEIPIGWQNLRLTLQGVFEAPVILERIEAVILSRRAPASGWFAYPDDYGKGESTIHRAVIDLDDERPLALMVKPREAHPGEFHLQPSYAFTVSEMDPEVFEIVAFTTASDIEWGLDIVYTVGGRRAKCALRDPGLRVTAHDGKAQQGFKFNDMSHVWEPVEGERFARNADYYRRMPLESRPRGSET